MAPQSNCPTANQRCGSYTVPRQLGDREIWYGKARTRCVICLMLDSGAYNLRRATGRPLVRYTGGKLTSLLLRCRWPPEKISLTEFLS
jgi:hypothetical protein